jgi:hypothetical protein
MKLQDTNDNMIMRSSTSSFSIRQLSLGQAICPWSGTPNKVELIISEINVAIRYHLHFELDSHLKGVV